jgi:DNA-binding response OmpR family regulator
MKMLVVEDDVSLRQAVARVLREEGYTIEEASAGDEGLLYAEQDVFDLVVLDVMLPGMDGLSVVRRLRARGVATPIVLLTARDGVEDRVRGLDAGADDYVVKPFAMQELLARVRAMLRRKGAVGADGELEFAGLGLRPRELEGYAGGQPLRLTQKEYKLLEYLLLNREQILTREQIMDRVWGFESDAAGSVVDVYIHYLRRKLAPAGLDALLHTVRGVGFMLRGSR